MSLEVWKKMGTENWLVTCSSAAATALDTGPNTATTWLLVIMLRTSLAPVAGVALASAEITLTVLPSTPPLALRSSTASCTPCRPVWPSWAMAPDRDVASPTDTVPPDALCPLEVLPLLPPPLDEALLLELPHAAAVRHTAAATPIISLFGRFLRFMTVAPCEEVVISGIRLGW